MDMIKAEAHAYDILFSESWLKPKFKIIVYLLKILCRLAEQTGVAARVAVL